MAEGEDRRRRGENGSEDLFEDLDQFFASIDERDWPEPAEGEPGARGIEQGRRDPSGETGGGDRPGGPTGWRRVMGGGGTQPPDEPTGEMSREDWRRLRDVLGEEGDEEEAAREGFPFRDATRAAAGDEPATGDASGAYARDGSLDDDRVREADLASAGAGGPEPGELSLEDLRRAPPEYGDLPRPREEGETAVDVGEVGTPSEEGVGLRRSDEMAGEDEDDAFARGPLAGVEAAADQIAEEFRTPPDDVDEDLLADLGAPARRTRTVKVGEPESLIGPAWEEPSSRTVTPETVGEPERARNLPAATVTGAALVVAAVVSVFVSKGLFALLAGAIVLLGQAELYGTMQRRNFQPATALGLVGGALTLAGAYLVGERGMLFAVALTAVLSFMWYMAAAPKARTGAVANIGATVLGVAYVPLLAGYVLLILSVPGPGRSLMLTVLALAFLYDIAAFAFGSIWGSRPLAPTISPKKSWEGLVGGTAVTFLVGFGIVPTFVDVLPAAKALGLWAVVAIFAPLGDLVESTLKRDLGVKDMGTLLPGHGGVLDRIDSALLVAPAAFYFFRVIDLIA